MYNIMWRPGKEPTPAAQFFLGSSIAGANWKDTKGLGLWKITVQRQRFDIFYQNLGPKPFPESIFNEKCPAELRGAAFKYGNCAETYPFLFNIRDGDNTELRGLALQKDFMISQTLTEYDPYKGGLIWSNLVAACENCSHVIGFVGAKTDNFLDTYEESDAPTKPTTSQTRATMDNATTTPNPAAAVTAPPGWSNKPEDLKTSYYWGPDGAGTAAAASVGLTNAQGLLIAARSNGGDRYIFQDGAGKIYMWGMVTDDVTLFTKPTALDEIVAQLKLPIGKLSIETKVLDYIPSDG
ncbi:hypothetical protein F4861DRAFT_510662 [Xylaria intraflava]|nr:hypothetical protein F4861DRAFT_510662 [Xylaria intraflava]